MKRSNTCANIASLCTNVPGIHLDPKTASLAWTQMWSLENWQDLNGWGVSTTGTEFCRLPPPHLAEICRPLTSMI